MAYGNQYYGGQAMYPQQFRYEPQNQIPQPAAFNLKGRPVGSIDEARASMIDFDGTTFYFPDVARRCIYTKRINMDGTSSLETYQLVETPTAPILTGDFVTNDTFNKTIQDIVKQIDSMKGMINNVQQPANGGNTTANATQQSNEQFVF
jgi:hypothetical protein